MLNLQELSTPVTSPNLPQQVEPHVLHAKIGADAQLFSLLYNFARAEDKTISKKDFKTVITNGHAKVSDSKLNTIVQVLNMFDEMFDMAVQGIDSLSLIDGQINAVSLYNKILNPGIYGMGGEPRWVTGSTTKSGYRSDELMDAFNSFLSLNTSIQDPLTQALNIGAFLAQSGLYTFRNIQTAVMATNHELILRGFPPVEYTAKFYKDLSKAVDKQSFTRTREALSGALLAV